METKRVLLGESETPTAWYDGRGPRRWKVRLMRALKGLPWLLLVLCSAASTAQAQGWAQQMFDHQSHDFGTVARGAKAEHRFNFQNVFEEDLNIYSVTSSCGCTVPSVTLTVVRKWEKAAVVAVLDTRAFSGARHATLTVRIRGYKGGVVFEGEVLLNVTGAIRQDVVVQPGVVDLGSVPQGSAVERHATIAYAGNPNWQITAVQNANPSLNVHLVESGRDIQRVNYDLTVSVKPDAPPGYIKDQLVLITNENNLNSARVPVPVEGVVTPGLTVHPSPLILNSAAGEQSQARLLVKSQAPFHVTGVTCADSRFKFELPAAASALQWVQVRFTAEAAAERVAQTLHITTDAAGSAQLEAVVQVTVTAGAAASARTEASRTAAPKTIEPKISAPKTDKFKSVEAPKAVEPKSPSSGVVPPKATIAPPAKTLINDTKPIAPAADGGQPTWRVRPHRMVPFPQETPTKPTNNDDAPASPLPQKPAPKKSSPGA